mmetsp:Transcript_37056/g.52354  ORF Transcript_37056/g.52354 Transcript_37056/m.52354 type:complete len:90 (-) Transcript_37056:189-458(-)
MLYLMMPTGSTGTSFNLIISFDVEWRRLIHTPLDILVMCLLREIAICVKSSYLVYLLIGPLRNRVLGNRSRTFSPLPQWQTGFPTAIFP